jgi:hypothetical protein
MKLGGREGTEGRKARRGEGNRRRGLFLGNLQLGFGLKAKFGNLYSALKFAYPEVEWDEPKFSLLGKKSMQKYFRLVLVLVLLALVLFLPSTSSLVKSNIVSPEKKSNPTDRRSRGVLNY